MTSDFAKPLSFKLDAHMRAGIEQCVARDEKRKAFLEEGVKAWKDYQATGLHLTEEEADGWLDRLEIGYEEEPPACHA
jgi:predicted transcriptional regulator